MVFDPGTAYSTIRASQPDPKSAMARAVTKSIDQRQLAKVPHRPMPPVVGRLSEAG
jgi:hypothetical protein